VQRARREVRLTRSADFVRLDSRPRLDRNARAGRSRRDYFLLGHRAEELLVRIKAWMARENAVIMAVLCLVIGAKLLGDGISGLG
jgi:hypothetical protein